MKKEFAEKSHGTIPLKPIKGSMVTVANGYNPHLTHELWALLFERQAKKRYYDFPKQNRILELIQDPKVDINSGIFDKKLRQDFSSVPLDRFIESTIAFHILTLGNNQMLKAIFDRADLDYKKEILIIIDEEDNENNQTYEIPTYFDYASGLCFLLGSREILAYPTIVIEDPENESVEDWVHQDTIRAVQGVILREEIDAKFIPYNLLDFDQSKKNNMSQFSITSFPKEHPDHPLASVLYMSLCKKFGQQCDEFVSGKTIILLGQPSVHARYPN